LTSEAKRSELLFHFSRQLKYSFSFFSHGHVHLVMGGVSAYMIFQYCYVKSYEAFCDFIVMIEIFTLSIR